MAEILSAEQIAAFHKRNTMLLHPDTFTQSLCASHEALRAENLELKKLFDLQHGRMSEATELWRAENPGNEYVLPDLGQLLSWLLASLSNTRAENERLRADGERLPLEVARIAAARYFDVGIDPSYLNLRHVGNMDGYPMMKLVKAILAAFDIARSLDASALTTPKDSGNG